MKANELSCKDLMIGDWVMINPISYYQVEQIRMEFGELRIYLKGTEVFATENEIMPIPLTPEILEKNGWIYIAEDKVFYSENLKGELPWIYYITDGTNEIFRMKDFFNLQYVHELQHALRLCGIEKEIIL